MSASIATTNLETFLSMPIDKQKEELASLVSKNPLEFVLPLIHHPKLSKVIRRDIPIECLIKRVHLDKVVEMIREINKSESNFDKEDNWNLAFRVAAGNGDAAIVKDILKESKTIDKGLHLMTIRQAAEYKKYDLLHVLVENSVSMRSSAIAKIFSPAPTAAPVAPDLTAINTILATGPIFDKTRDLTIENTSLTISLIKRALKSGDLDAGRIASLKQLEKDYTEVRTTMEESETVNRHRLCLAIDGYRLFVREKTAKEFGYTLSA